MGEFQIPFRSVRARWLIARHEQPLGLGNLMEVDTNAPVDFPALLQRVRAAPAG